MKQYLNWRTVDGRKVPCRPDGTICDAHDPFVLNLLLDYNPVTGEMIWKSRVPEMFSNSGIGSDGNCRRWNTRFCGKPAFTSLNEGYRRGTILGKNITLHVAAWTMMKGEPPISEIDHENGIRTDNRWVNLRETDVTGNNRNRAIHRNNKSGVSGVSFDQSRGRWRVGIGTGSKWVNMGRFVRLEDAILARKKAEKIHDYHRNHGRKS